MLVHVKAIALRAIEHGDRTFILKAWTSHAGARSYLVRAGGKRGSAMAALQPLSRIEVVADERPDRDLHQARELRVEEPYARLHTEPLRAAIALFAQELFCRVLRTETADHELDRELRSILSAMDAADHLRWLPHQIMIALTGPLGFRPQQPEPGETHFDLQEGRFLNAHGQHLHLLSPPLSTALAQLLAHPIGQDPESPLSSAQRKDLLDRLLLYYRLHLEGMGEMRSPSVLHAVLG
jgi:DNA repair protein RecO (recombination protein O)